MEDSESESEAAPSVSLFSKGALKLDNKKISKTEKPAEYQPKPKSPNSDSELKTSFEDLGLSEWAVQICKELGMKEPNPVQKYCIPEIMKGKDVMGLAQTGSGKTAAFALPILHKLAENPYGVFGLVITPTRELAFQLAEQFRALGAPFRLRCTVVVGGMNMTSQAQALMQRPHVVIATPGRIRSLLSENLDVPKVLSRAKSVQLMIGWTVDNWTEKSAIFDSGLQPNEEICKGPATAWTIGEYWIEKPATGQEGRDWTDNIDWTDSNDWTDSWHSIPVSKTEY